MKGKNHLIRVPVSQTRGFFSYSFTVTDSVFALVIGFVDNKFKVVDNNNEIGYIIYLPEPKGNIPAIAYINAMDLLSYYAIRPLNLDYPKTRPIMIQLFETAYRKSKALKDQRLYYTYYLSLLLQEKGDSVKPLILNYAREMSNSEGDESRLIDAAKAYELIGMNSQKEEIEKVTAARYPNGITARSQFIDSFYVKDTTESLINEAINAYIDRFHDTSVQMRYTFYTQMLGVLLNGKKYDRLLFYENLNPSKSVVGKSYITYAMKLSGGEQLDNNGSDLKNAEWLARRAFLFFSSLFAESKVNGDEDGSIRRIYNNFISSYCIVLYKLNKFDSAFYYQDLIYQQGNNNIADIERYIAYAKKAKGAAYACNIIMGELQSGVSSLRLAEQLAVFGREAGIPDSTIAHAKSNSENIANKSLHNKIKKLFGSQKFKDINLKNPDGLKISLSSYSNKIVVLDFWATWCIPCIASFDEMNKLVFHYKDNPEIVFLFINIWEQGNTDEIIEKSKTFLRGKGYDFNLLFDLDGTVANTFKINEIPASFILDKNGEIVFMGQTANVAEDIEKIITQHL